MAYHLAWLTNTLGALLTLILHPPAHKIPFPPIPLAAVSASSGYLQVSRTGSRTGFHISARCCQLRRLIIKDVPTNTQLALMLLRIAEDSKTLLPPPLLPPTNNTTEEPDKHPDGIETAVRENDHMGFDTHRTTIPKAWMHMAKR